MNIPLRNRIERSISSAIGSLTRRRPEALRLYLDGLPQTADTFLRGYMLGYYPFPDADGVQRWRSPDERGVIMLDEFKVPKKARASIRKQNYKVRFDYDVEAVIRACAEPTPRRPQTWLTEELLEIYRELIKMGVLHSVEAWKDGELVGGEYGVAIGGYFCSESAFSRQRDASKVTLVYLHRSLRESGFDFIDVQYVNDYLKPFGARLVSREEFRPMHLRAIVKRCKFGRAESDTRSTLPPYEV